MLFVSMSGLEFAVERRQLTAFISSHVLSLPGGIPGASCVLPPRGAGLGRGLGVSPGTRPSWGQLGTPCSGMALGRLPDLLSLCKTGLIIETSHGMK